MMHSGFWPLAAPTARAAAGRPRSAAIAPYVRVSANGMWVRALHTSFCKRGPPRTQREVKRRPLSSEVLLELEPRHAERHL